MKQVTVTIKISIAHQEFKCDEFQEFLGSIDDGEFVRDFIGDDGLNIFDDCSIVYDVKEISYDKKKSNKRAANRRHHKQDVQNLRPQDGLSANKKQKRPLVSTIYNDRKTKSAVDNLGNRKNTVVTKNSKKARRK